MTEQSSKKPGSYTEKLGLSASTLSTLYVFPMAAQAAVVHVTTPITLSIHDVTYAGSIGNGVTHYYHGVDWDVDGNSLADVSLEAHRYKWHCSSTTYGGGNCTFHSGGINNYWTDGNLRLNSSGLAGQGMVQNYNDVSRLVQNLSLGSTIGPTLASGRQWSPSTDRAVMNTYREYIGDTRTNALVDGSNHIGLRFLGDNNLTLYAWAEINLDTASQSMTINQWAYEDSGAGILVGQTASVVPLPPSFFSMLGGLALGAGGVLRGRRARKAAQPTESVGH